MDSQAPQNRAIKSITLLIISVATYTIAFVLGWDRTIYASAIRVLGGIILIMAIIAFFRERKQNAKPR